METKNNLGFHKQGFDALKFVHKQDHTVLPTALLSALIKCLYPYIGLVLSAHIIDALLTKQWNRVGILVVILLVGNFLGGTLLDILNQVSEVKYFKIAKLADKAIRMKALDLDYETLENASTLERINSAIYSMQYRGGYGSLVENYCKIFEGVFSIITSVSFVSYLCFQMPVNTKGVLGFFASPIFSLLFLIVILLGTLLFNLKILKYYNDKSIAQFNKKLKAERTLQYYMEQIMFDFSKGKVIRLYDMYDMILNEYKKANDFIRSVYHNMQSLFIVPGVANSSCSGIISLISYLFVGIKVTTGAITIGGFTQYVGSISKLNGAMSLIATNHDEIRVQMEYIQIFQEFIKLENKRETGTIPIEKRKDNCYEIEFHNVSFSYPGSEEKILKNVSCKLDLKKKIAVVGRNGAGKTTFIKLLCRLYDPVEGLITLNGIDIKKYDYEQYLYLFSVVFQDFSLFAFPLEQNVATKLHENLNKDKVEHCLKLAGIYDKVSKMKLGIETPLYQYDKDGVEISGGEAQKIAIARALYKDAPFVVLDEPTAALDPISEYEIYSHFDELVKDKTSIYISHRMSSCRFCNDIIVFEEGRITERGSHEILMEREGLYHSLWEAQADYYTV